MHIDITETIYESQMNRLTRGEKLTEGELIEIICMGTVVMKAQLDIACNCAIKYANTVLENQKDSIRERRIFNLFLQNHGIDDYDYDSFESRILKKLFEIQDSKEGQSHG